MNECLTSKDEEIFNNPLRQTKTTTLSENLKNDFKDAFNYEKNKLTFTRNVICFIFLTNLFINMDHGSIPSATQEIKKYLDIDDGVFGSHVYLGNLLGKIII